MADTPEMTQLDGKMLIAMPSIGDPRFDRTVIYICAHSDGGAMGLIVNKPATSLSFADLLEQLEITSEIDLGDVGVHYGGPVEHGRGFVLHSLDYQTESGTMNVMDDLGMTATLDVLEDIANGVGPKQRLLALGYAGWGPGQLESELRSNGWLVCDGSAELVFSEDNDAKWQGALDLLGIDPRLLSAEGGSA